MKIASAVGVLSTPLVGRFKSGQKDGQKWDQSSMYDSAEKSQARPGSFLDLVGGAIQSRGQAFGELELEI